MRSPRAFIDVPHQSLSYKRLQEALKHNLLPSQKQGGMSDNVVAVAGLLLRRVHDHRRAGRAARCNPSQSGTD